jgi:RNA polymerase sigma factor (sigma-70 family)
MASVMTSGTTLRHLRDLFSGGSSVGLGDGQLLARYAADRDGPAFAALVARHGPMVAATCRAVLRNEHDVEDAFQATFLVLAHKAGSLRVGDALGGWLHRVAYRAAVEASVRAKRRRRREAEASTMANADAARPGLDPEIAAIVHEEVDRLPEGLRLPVVLCDLEGLTYEQAASRLDWTEPTLRHRLVKAREKLRDRLGRRGVTGAAPGVVIAASDATAVVPLAWAESVVVAATGGAGSMAAVALTRIILRGMLMTKLKIVGAAGLVAIGIASVGVFAIGAGRPDDPKSAMNAPTAAGTLPVAREAHQPVPPAGEMVEVRGRVVGPDGKPVPGAVVRRAWIESKDATVPDATTGADGWFLARVPRPIRDTQIVSGDEAMLRIGATAPGFGPGWVARVFRPDNTPGELTIRLDTDGPPIEGRIVDLEGRLVVGAEVKVDCLWFAGAEGSRYVETGDLLGWLGRVKDRGIRQGPQDGLERFPMTIGTTTTGPDGRFRLTGIGRGRIAEVTVSGPTIATTRLYAICYDGPEMRGIDQDSPEHQTFVFHARRFEHAVAPTQPIEGVVRDKDTGRPIAGVKLRGAVYKDRDLRMTPGVEATTDAQGRYRLTGVLKGPAYRLSVEPGEGLPYPAATLRATAGSPALEPVAFDIALKRGILVRGRVTDKATGQPVPGMVSAYAFRDNPLVREFPGYALSQPPYVEFKDDGRFEVVALPGRGIIACRSELGRYRSGVGAEAIKGNRTLFDTLPRPTSSDGYHALAAVDLDPKVESVTLDLQVDPGRSLSVTVVDPDGKPIGGTKASGIGELVSHVEYEQDSPTIEIHALDPSKPRRVTITHAGRKLVGSVYLKGVETGPLTVRLQPWGTITGRIIDDEGKPRGGVGLMNGRGGTDPGRPAEQGVLPGGTRRGTRIGSDGRFRIEGLVPGLKYGANARVEGLLRGDLFQDVTVSPGEVKDLGDLKVVPPKRRAGL